MPVGSLGFQEVLEPQCQAGSLHKVGMCVRLPVLLLEDTSMLLSPVWMQELSQLATLWYLVMLRALHSGPPHRALALSSEP